jgi:hypothetical protein
MFYLTNAFSLNMLDTEEDHISVIETERISQSAAISDIRSQCDDWDGDFTGINAIGHPSTDAIVRDLIGHPFGFPEGQRLSITMNNGDWAIVAQYSGPRLPEGATELPEGAKIIWFRIRVL